MKDLFFLIICIATLLLTVLPFIKAFDESKTWNKVLVTLIVFSTTAIATWKREQVIDLEEKERDQKLTQRDSINASQLLERDLEHKKAIFDLSEMFSNKLIDQGQQINKTIPSISPFNIKTVKEGLKISYTIYKPIERLKLIILPNVFDQSHEPSFGTETINLPKKIGENFLVIPPTKIPFGRWAKFQINCINPHLNSVVFEHFNFVTSSSGQILLTADNDFITTDNDKFFVSDDSISVDDLR